MTGGAATGGIASGGAQRLLAIEVAFDDPRVREESAAVALLTWKDACALFQLDAASEEPPVTLTLHPTLADYEAACDRLVDGNFKRNLAFAEWTTPSAHVVLQPTISGDALARLAPTFETLRLVGHETAHLVRYRRFPNHRDHPGWFADGCGSWLETQALAARGLMTTPEHSPRHATDVLRVQRLLEQRKLPSAEDLVLDRTDSLEFFDRYATRWLFFRFLLEGPHAKAFREFPVELRRLGGGREFTARAAEALRKQLRLRDWKALDTPFRAWLEELEPQWDERIGSLETGGEEWAQTSAEQNAVAFVTEAAGVKCYALEGSVTVLLDRAGTPQMNVLLGRQELSNGASRFVSVAIVPGIALTVFAYDGGEPEADQWRRLASAPLPATAVGSPVEFRIECTTKPGRKAISALVVKIAGTTVAEAKVERALDGPWGLGAQRGSSGIWRGVQRVALGSR